MLFVLRRRGLPALLLALIALAAFSFFPHTTGRIGAQAIREGVRRITPEVRHALDSIVPGSGLRAKRSHRPATR